MKFENGWYCVEVKCTKENAAEMVGWFGSLGKKIEKIESALGEEPSTLVELAEKINENGGSAGFIFEVHFKDEESALLTKMKYGK